MSSAEPVKKNPGITVQVLAFHPFTYTSILLVHNLLEAEITPIEMYGFTAKPPGWGNGGGGMEPDELERLKHRDPKNWILTDPDLTDEERMVAACGLREFVDEGGYHELSLLRSPSPRGDFSLFEQLYPGGHRKIILWGEVESLARRPIYEVSEIDQVEWFDLEKPLPRQFDGTGEIFLPRGRTGFPYWSHVRVNLLSIFRLDRYGDRRKIAGRIHPSWYLVFPVGVGDERFPKGGHRIPPPKWYYLIEHMIREEVDELDNDVLYEFFKDDILAQKRSDGEEVAVSPAQIPEEEIEADEEIPEPVYEGNAVKMLQEQDSEYREWMEQILRESGRF